jgi:hypothetical protein
VFFISDKEFLIENEIFMFDIPYADYFSVRQYLYIDQDPNQNYSMTLTYPILAFIILDMDTVSIWWSTQWFKRY